MRPIKTLPIIRHVRWIFNLIAFEKHMMVCRAMGLGFAPQKSDIEYLEGIRKGLH